MFLLRLYGIVFVIAVIGLIFAPNSPKKTKSSPPAAQTEINNANTPD